MAKRTWYEKYIGYCFNDNGREAILNDVFYWEDENGKNRRTGYEMYYPKTNEWSLIGYKQFMEIKKQTCLPK